MSLSFQNNDNFIRNLVTIRGGGYGSWRAEIRRLTESADLPVDVEEIMLDLRIDAPDDERATITRYARTACAFLERRTACVLLGGTFEVMLPGWWDGPLEIRRFPVRSIDGIAYLAGKNDWHELEPDDVAAMEEGPSFFMLEAYPTFDRPTLWSDMNRVRLRFTAGFDDAGDSGVSDARPILEPWRGLITACVGHYLENRELMQADRIGAVEHTMGSLLGSVRQFW